MAQKPSNDTETTEANATEALEQAQKNEVATKTEESSLRLGSVNIDETPQDIASSGGIPVLKTAYGVGNLANEGHLPGTIVLGDYVLAHVDEPLKIYTVGVDFYWKEVTEYVRGQFVPANKVRTRAEVHALGKTTDWTDDPNVPGKRLQPDYRPAADFIFLIEQPKDLVSPHFTLRLGDSVYGLARYYADKTAYDKAGEPIVKVVAGADRPYAFEFEFLTSKYPVGGETRVFPRSRLVGQTDAELAEAIASALAEVG